MWGMKTPPVHRREIFAWACFDFANSAYTTVIVTVVYGVYFAEVVMGGREGGLSVWSWMLATSQVVVIVLAPALGALADVRAWKKRFLAVSAAVCCLATSALWWTGPGTVGLAFMLVVVANTAFSLGENFCASFLPELSTPANAGRISALGWGFGYCGGLLSLGLALALVQNWPGDGVRATFIMTGLFFALACVPTLVWLRERAKPRMERAGQTVRIAWGRLLQTFHEVRQHRRLAWFFLAFFFYMSGLSAVFAFAAIVAVRQFGFSQAEVIGLFAVLQISAATGALGFGWLQDHWGVRPVLGLSLAGWIGVSLAVVVAREQAAFWWIGAGAGLVMGSTQSASRAVVSILTPPAREGEMFGFWGLFGKLAALVGPLIYGTLADEISLPAASAVNAALFMLGLAIFWFSPAGHPEQRLAGNK